MTADQARLKARSLLGDVATGDDPAELRRRRRLTPTVAEVCNRFVKEHVEVRLKPKSVKEYKRLIQDRIAPALGTFKISEVTRADVSALHQAQREHPYQANRILGVLSKLFNLCELWGYRPDGSNPCRLIQRYKETRKERFLSDEEIARLSNVIAEAEASGEITVFVAAAFRMLLLTGCRLSEIQFLRWEHVTRTHLSLPDTKTGKRNIPLPDTGRKILEMLPRQSDNPFVFQGSVEGKPAVDIEKPWRKLRAKAGLEDVRIHDLRHTYASKALASGMSLYMVGQLLGHTQYQTTMRYAHLADAPVRDAANAVATSVQRSMATSSHQPTSLRLVE